MNEEVEESGIIIQDFSAVSEWEIFVLKIEEVLNEWKLSDVPRDRPLETNELSRSHWTLTKDTIQYGDEEFLIVRYKLILEEKKHTSNDLEEKEKYSQAFVDIFAAKNDFNPLHINYTDKIPLLSIWYGLRDFVIVVPKSHVTDESRIKILLSSITIAVNNSCCEVPVFLQCRDDWQQYYLGICENKGLCIKFDTIHLRRLPSQCYHLDGLLDLFKGKIASTISLDTVCVSTKFTYSLSDWSSSTWMQQPPDFDFVQAGVTNFSTIPIGAVCEPIKSLLLFVSWLELSDDSVVDSQNYTDFNPMIAPIWAMKINMELDVNCLLFDLYDEFINLSKKTTPYKDLLYSNNDLDFDPSNTAIPKSRSMKGITSKMSDSYTSDDKYQRGALSNDTILEMLKYIFLIYEHNFEHLVEESSPFYVGGDTLKADPRGGIIWRLAVSSARVYQDLGGSEALAHLWHEFCQELRCRWENSIQINGVMDGYPNTRTSLLHQKLQMLNVCIDRRKRRDEAAQNQQEQESDSDDSDDEFYECNEDLEVPKKKLKPIGRLEKFGNLKLLKTGDPIYVPVTQEPVPKTEDELEQYSDVMKNSGMNPEDCLHSDMQSFKAANPDAIFDDFIRWYSPKDWIQEEELDEFDQKKGHLSVRMTIPENIWVQLWQSAGAVPAKRQRRLFDDTVEAVKTLNYLESRKISEIVELLLPSLTHAILFELGNNCKDKDGFKQLEALFKYSIGTATKLTRDNSGAHMYKHFSGQIYNIELLMSQWDSLKKIFTQTDDDVVLFLTKLIKGEEANLPGAASGTLGKAVCLMFKNAQKSEGVTPEPVVGNASNAIFSDKPFGTPDEKEFVLRVKAKRPSSTSRPSPQMMRIILKKQEFRILGAFTEDVIFS